MANNFFTFKQFTIYQDKCAMKVCTDACLFGAYVANEIRANKKENITCLDIGAGTGLLSLMVAQKNNVQIDAVEIDKAAFLQAGENIGQSAFKNKISIYHKDVLQFDLQKKYGIIFSNPPFFENDLLSGDGLKNTAKHNATLVLDELITVIHNLLNEKGFFAVLLPYHRLQYFEATAFQYKFYLSKKILVKQTAVHDYFRGILFFSREQKDGVVEEIFIKDEKGEYSDNFIELLKDYYFYF